MSGIKPIRLSPLSQHVIVVIATASVVAFAAARNDAAGQLQTAAAGGQGASDTGGGARLPWGDPDLQGIWSSGYIETPLERPGKHGGRELLTDDEVRAELERLEAQQDHSTGSARRPVVRAGDTGTYNTAFSGRGRDVIRTRRTSLVIDPPDGKIPWQPGVREKVAAEMQLGATRRGASLREDNERGGDGPEDRPNDRCRGIMLPPNFGTYEVGGAHHRIVQSPGTVSIYYEYGPHGGAYRTIPLDGGTHLPPGIRQWLGDARGRWDGNTLVVDATNFTDQTNYMGSRDNLQLVERFTRVAADLIMYRATIEDPTVFTRPWTIEVPLTKRDEKANQIFESACHEGNYGLTGILAGARALERERAAKKTK